MGVLVVRTTGGARRLDGVDGATRVGALKQRLAAEAGGAVRFPPPEMQRVARRPPPPPPLPYPRPLTAVRLRRPR